MKKQVMIGFGLVLLVVFAGAARAEVITLTFEGLSDYEYVNDFYNDGRGENYGITFKNAQALINSDAGGSGNFSGEPSPHTVIRFLGTALPTMSPLSTDSITMNILDGCTDGFSFYYSAIEYTGTITVYDGFDGTGNLLASLNLPLTTYNGEPDPSGEFGPFVPFGVAFKGTAYSVNFAGAADKIMFDNITLGLAMPLPVNPDPAPVPEPGTMLLLGAGLASLVAISRKRK